MTEFKIGGKLSGTKPCHRWSGRDDKPLENSPKDHPDTLPTDLVRFSSLKGKTDSAPAPVRDEISDRKQESRDPHATLVVFEDPPLRTGERSEKALLEIEGMGLLSDTTGLSQTKAPQNGGVRETFYHHIDWSGFSGKKPLQAGLDVLKGSRLRAARGRFTIDTWHGGLHAPPRPGQVTLVFSPEMPAQQRAKDIHQRTTGSGLNLSTDPHLEGILYNGSEMPQELSDAVAQLNQVRRDCGQPTVDLLPWHDFEDAWKAE